MASGIGKPLKLRLFLEGQEVPVIAASVSIGLNQPAACSVQVIPLDSGMELKPRTMVHLFYLDHVPSEAELTKAKESGITEETYKLSQYKLLFCGETVGFAFAQTPMSRSLVLQCLDFSSYWDAAHATAIEYGPNGNAFYNQSSMYASNASLFDDIVNFQSEKLVGWLRTKPKTPGLQNISGLAGGIITMLEAIGGVTTHFKGVNDFFTFSELRCRILAQITAEEKDNTASRLLSGKVFDEWLRNGLQNVGQQVTFRTMVQLMCNYIYYDFVPNPAAKYDQSIDGGSEKTTTTSPLNQNPLVLNAQATIQSAISDLSSAKGFDLTTTLGVLNTCINTHASLNDAAQKLKTVGSNAKNIASKVMSAQNTLQSLATKITTDAIKPDSILKSLDDALTDLVGAITLIAGNTTKVTVVNGVKSTATTARLRTQIFRPDCFFAAAPRCNVIFPEHYTQVSFDRNYLSEVTRSLTLVYNTLVGRDQMLADKIMAPNIGLDMAKIQKQVGSSSYRVMMPHERHTGIIPRTEWLPNTASFSKSAGGDRTKLRGARLSWANRAALFHFFKYRFGPRRISVAGKFNPNVVCGFPAVVILKPFMPSANTLREALKIKADDQLDAADKKILELVQSNGTTTTPLGAPFQLLGMVGSITHSIDQNGGTTTISMHHARQHLGADDEFVGIFSEERANSKSRIRVALTSDMALSQTEAKDRDSFVKLLTEVTPQGGTAGGSKTSQIQSSKGTSYARKKVDPRSRAIIQEEVQRSVAQTNEQTKTVSNYPIDPNGRIDGIERTVSIPKPPGVVTVGSKAAFGAKGKILGIEVVDPEIVTVPSGTFQGRKMYRSVILHEEIDISSVDLVPVEEIIRPSWFSPNYANPKIGENIYQPFFGTTSIIDDLRFTGLIPEAIVSTDDVEGQNYSPKTAFEEILNAENNKQKLRNQLSIEKAINVISYLYGLVRAEGKDVDQFIRDYTHRPIATMVDVLGTADLSVSYDAKGVPTIEKGKPGFHSLALDWQAIERGNLAGLLADPDQQLPRINNSGKKEPISPVYDVRKEKLDKVDAYVLGLKKGPGLRG